MTRGGVDISGPQTFFLEAAVGPKKKILDENCGDDLFFDIFKPFWVDFEGPKLFFWRLPWAPSFYFRRKIKINPVWYNPPNSRTQISQLYRLEHFEMLWLDSNYKF